MTETQTTAPPLPGLEQVRGWLEQVADPEIPAVSVVDLGIVRDVAWTKGAAGDELLVTITPTYSGCPATEIIAEDIRRALMERGIARVRLEVCLSPAWTTDWISEGGRERLRAYGIAPPVGKALDLDAGPACGVCAAAIACPRCGSANTRVVSRFGSTPCKAHYICDACLEPFDYFKPH